MAEAVDCVWATDLRGLPPFNFVQLYDQLVIKTAKYDYASIRSSGYKKLKAFQFFEEGQIRRTHISAKGGVTYVKGEVLVSIKPGFYIVVSVVSVVSVVRKKIHRTDITLAWFPYRCICRICRVCRTKKIHRTHRIHSISYNKLYLSFLLY